MFNVAIPSQLLDRSVVRRVPECMDRLDIGKLEHHDWPLIVFAFQHLHLCASGDKLSAEAGDERHDGLRVLLVLRFVFDRVLDNKIGGHNEPPSVMLWPDLETLALLRGASTFPEHARMRASRSPDLDRLSPSWMR